MAAATVAVVGVSTAVTANPTAESGSSESRQGSAAEAPAPGGDRRVDPDRANVKGEKVYRGLSREHTEGRVDYSGGPTPPAGGRHHPTWQNADGDVYTEPVRNEHAVHTLEHGAVWVTYSDRADAADVKALKAKVEGVPYRFMSPVPGQDSPVKLTAWGHQLSLRSADDRRVDQFFDAYVQGPQTPEQGAPVTGGRATP
ncbi:DUF3105 domain-containing protein [Streptomyces sp. HNM0574]|nr:DUF3105 domain-containing protein [Streptomyces sp. HNM0574]